MQMCIRKKINSVHRSFTKKILVFIIVITFICTAFNAAKIQNSETIIAQKETDRSIIWDVTLFCTESYGHIDNSIFGEAPDASDGFDLYDAADPGGPPTPPYLNCYFTTPFPYPSNKLMQEIKHYSLNNTYKVWNFSVFWFPADYVTPTTTTISWVIDEVNDSEYTNVSLCTSDGVFLTNMLMSSYYSFYNPAMTPQNFKIICLSTEPAAELDFGDAPEGSIAYPSTSVIGGFPTCYACGPSGWIEHTNFGAWFGPTVDFEYDGNAGLCPAGFPPYDQDDCYLDGDAGLIIPQPFTINNSLNVVPCPGGTGTSLGSVGQTVVWGTHIDINVHNTMPGHDPYLPGYVNVLIDWNQNGVWGDASEHVLQNFVIPALYIGPLSGLSPPNFTIGPNSGYVWTRFSITEIPVVPSWNGSGIFEDGETEDYLLQILMDYQPTACYTWVDADGIGSGTLLNFDATCSTDDYGITAYEWDWNNDGVYDATGMMQSYDFGDTNTHTVTLRVTDTIGQINTVSHVVQAVYVSNLPPIFGTPSPQNGSTNRPLSLNWSVPINDPEGDQFSWTIQCNNGQTNSGTGATNGTKTLILSGLSYATTYTVWVNATDPTGSGFYTRKWYTFTTKTSLPPVFGTPSPVNGSTNQPLSFTWSIMIIDPEGDLISWTIQCNNGQTNSGTGATNGTKTLILSGLSYATTYTVWVNATDPTGSGFYTRKWYTFTTKTSLPPVFGTPSPVNGSTNQPLSFTWSIMIIDPEGDLISWTIQCSNGETNSNIGDVNGTKILLLTGLSYLTTYTVWVNATDPTGSGVYTKAWYTFTTQQQQNQPPNKPNKPTGETSGKLNTPYTYSTSTTDPDGDQVYYQWDWGDGSTSSWLGPYNSGTIINTTHTWTVKSSSVKVKAKDSSGAESPWSDPLPITMPFSYHSIFYQLNMLIQLIIRFLRGEFTGMRLIQVLQIEGWLK